MPNKGYKHSLESREKIRQANLGSLNHFYGKYLTEEHKAKISAGNKGKYRSEETKTRIKASRLGIPHSKETKAKIATTLRGRKLDPFSPEHCAKIAATLRGHKVNPETRAKLAAANRGRKHSLESRAKIGAAQRGRKHSPEAVAATAAANRGRKASAETRAKMSGVNHYKWKGGLSNERDKFRAMLEYRDWRLAVYARDNYTCQYCLERGGRLNAHHIKSFAEYPELRLDVSNELTLCLDCHKNLHRRK